MRHEGIDIVITTCNGSATIGQLLEAISRQTYREFTCYVVDDNSSDDTAAIIKERFPWVVLTRREKNCGPSQNRNLAIRKGTGKYIAIFDDDVVLKSQTWLEDAVKEMEKDQNIGQVASMIVSAYDEDILLDCGITGEYPEFAGIFWKRNKKDCYGKHAEPRKVLGACTAGTMVRREAFELAGGFDPKYYYMAEDLDLSMRICLAGYDIAYCPALVVHHYESQAMNKRGNLKKYLGQRNSLLVLLENYPAAYAMKKSARAFVDMVFLAILLGVRVFTGGEKKDTAEIVKNHFKAFFFILFNLAGIIKKRRVSDKARKRDRQYLVSIHKKTQKEIALRLPLRNMTFLVTNKCNANCGMCFLFEDINQKAEILTLSEIKLMFAHITSLKNIVLGGGEPFLREDIDLICRFLAERFPSIVITIPTNGSLPDVIYEKTKMILGYGCADLVISLSLDGLGEYHDSNRGIKGLFDNVKKSYDKLSSLKNIFGDALHIQVNTCVTRGNIGQLEDIFEYVRGNMPDASWVFEPIRGSFDRSKNTELSAEEWQGLVERSSVFRKIDPVCLNKTVCTLFKYAQATIVRSKQVVPCSGGDEFITVDHAGNVFPCEIIKPAGINLRDIGYDINGVLGIPAWNNEVRGIKEGKCFCTHFCWLGASLDKCGLMNER